jgi:hypothetical protein
MKAVKRILLGQLASYGDCLYATAIARQIKHDNPDCHLTWAVGAAYRDAITHNPYVDAIWEIPLSNRNEIENAWRAFVREARRRRSAGEFDEFYLTQVAPDNYQNFDGTLRSSIFRGYPRPITVPVTPSVRLQPDEIARVRQFVSLHGLDRAKQVILVESTSYSRQSFITPEFALDAARLVLAKVPDCAFILSSSQKTLCPDKRIVDGSVLRFRENAELTKYCTLLVGGSSGISWLATSDWAKRLPTIQLLRRDMGVYASMCHDAEHFGLPTNHIIEMTECSPADLANCIITCFQHSFGVARQQFHEQIEVDLHFYIERFMRSQLRQFHPLKVIRSVSHVYKRYGRRPFVSYLRSKLHLSKQESQ